MEAPLCPSAAFFFFVGLSCRVGTCRLPAALKSSNTQKDELQKHITSPDMKNVGPDASVWTLSFSFSNNTGVPNCQDRFIWSDRYNHQLIKFNSLHQKFHQTQWPFRSASMRLMSVCKLNFLCDIRPIIGEWSTFLPTEQRRTSISLVSTF